VRGVFISSGQVGKTFLFSIGESGMPTDDTTKSLVGSWSAVITAIDQGATFPGLLSFTSDGVLLVDEVPAAFETTGHGNWLRTGPLSAAYTFLFLIGSSENKLSARGKVNGALKYDSATDGWQGPFKIWVTDEDGNQAMMDHGMVTCMRIEVEMLD
jgi:hypothetical protein